MTLSDLAQRFNTIADNVPLAASRVTTQIATQLERELVTKTPVDTSKALSNWQLTLGTKALAPIPPYFPGLQGSTQAASAEAAYNLAVTTLQRKEPGVSVWVTNLLPYIQRLNQGWSQQAPAGYVDTALAKARLIVAQKKLGL